MIPFTNVKVELFFFHNDLCENRFVRKTFVRLVRGSAMYLGRRPHLWLNLILISLLTFGLRTEFDSSVHHCGYPKTKNLDINETTDIAKLALLDLESEGRNICTNIELIFVHFIQGFIL